MIRLLLQKQADLGLPCLSRPFWQATNVQNFRTFTVVFFFSDSTFELGRLAQSVTSDFIWPFLRPYMGVIPNPKMAFIFPISCIFALIFPILIKYFPKCVGKSSFPKSQIKSLVTCLSTDACLTADPGVASSIPVRSHTFVEIDHEMISTVILLPSADSFKKGCCQLQAKVCARITGEPLVQACPGKSVVM